MKGLILIILVFFYSALSIQLHASLHFCKGRFISIKLFESNTNKKCCEGLMIKKDCCKHYQLVLKKQSQESDTKINISASLEPISNFYINNNLDFFFHFYKSELAVNNCKTLPPTKSKLKIFILNSVFRI